MKSYGNHIGLEKEEQLKWTKIEVENKVKKILKLAKGMNGNKDGNLKKKSEIIHLVEDVHQHYESLYSLYEDLRGEVKKNVNGEDNGSSSSYSSSSPSDSESYYSPVESTPKRNGEVSFEISKDYVDSEISYVEDTILKDKLTSSSEVKETTSFASRSQEFNGISENTNQRVAQTEFEGELARLKVEVECKSNEAMQMREENWRLEARVLELESSCKDKELLQLEVKALNVEKGELEERLSCETKERSLQVKGLMEQVDSLQQKLVSMISQKSELQLEVLKKSTEPSEYLVQIENHRNKSTNQDSIEKGFMEENEISEIQVEKGHSFSSQRSKHEEQMMKINPETYQSELQRKISQVKTSLSVSEKLLSAEKRKLNACQIESSSQIEFLNGKVKNLENKLEILQNERSSSQMELEELRNEKRELSLSKSKCERMNTELIDKIAAQQKTLLELGDAMCKLKAENERTQIKFTDSKPSNFQLVERKIDEMAKEFRKQFEDKFRILNRRIRVAEQLHVENREWYHRIKEQENKDVQESIRNVKEISLTANDMLLSLDSLSLKFEDCNANFLNRISKASCELKFAKEWAGRKNKALVHVKDDLDELLLQLDEKEAEILVIRERVWRSEKKSRELEKMMKKKEDAMVGLEEEKREAIRQLCVWIDYHRSRSEYYMKMLTEMNQGRRKAS